MSGGGDLVPLFATDSLGSPPLKFRQGVVKTWNADTGQNTVLVQDVELVDVPMLNTGEAIALKAGHIVGLITWGSSWFIIGRITTPGSPDFAGASVAFGGTGGSSQSAFSVTTTPLDKVSASIVVPAWADEAIVMVTADCSIVNTSATSFYVQIGAYIDGTLAGGGAQFGLAPQASVPGNIMGGACGGQRLITNPGSSISVSTKVWVTSGTVPSNANSIANVNATAVFRSTV